MKSISKKRLLSLATAMFALCAPALANSTTYYSKVEVTAVGDGKVYASASSSSSPAYAEGSSSATTNGSSQSQKFYVYAQPNEGNEFSGWYDNASCAGDVLSTESSYTVTVNATSTTSSTPTTMNVYAKFVAVGAPSLSFTDGHTYANLSAGTYKNESLTTKNVTVEEITYESSNENVATVAADGTVTVIKNGSCIITAKFEDSEGSYILTVIDDIAAGVTQIGNGDFENWSSATSSNHAPNNWNSFETAEGGYASFVSAQQVAMADGGRPGSDGLYCADIYSRSVLGIPAQGNITVGCINAGSTSASDKNNYNFSKVSDPSKSETIAKVPSAIKLWVKFVPAKVNASHPNARISAYVHDAHNYITYSSESDNTDENKSYVIAQTELNFPACDWQEVVLPFNLTGNTTDGQMYILVNISTNADPGEGQAGDHLYIDDIELVYPEEGEPVVYEKYIDVAVNGTHAEPQKASIEVTYNDDNTIDFNLKNFALDNDGTAMYVGNITLPGLAMDEDGNFSFDGSLTIAEGDQEGVALWLGPSLGDIPLALEGTIKDDYFYVHIDINVGYPVEVQVGDLANATVSVSDALISTFCAPFAVAIPEAYQSAVTASTVSSVQGYSLVLEPVENNTIPANTPVVIEAAMAAELPVSGIYRKSTTLQAGLLTGVFEDTPAPVGSYVMQSIDDKVGFYQVAGGAQPTVGANHCFLTVPASDVKAFFFGEDGATAIKSIDNGQEAEAPAYNLAGQRIGRMQKGINIINGKKILK